MNRRILVVDDNALIREHLRVFLEMDDFEVETAPDGRSALTALRDGLDSCIGCGCLSLQRCQLSNAGDRLAQFGPGAQTLPPLLRRSPAEGV